jgi:homopolymeric O-antigen transport system permease protein
MALTPYKSRVRIWNCVQLAARDLASGWERVRLVSVSAIFAAHRKSALGVVWAYILPVIPVSAFVFIRLAIQPEGEVSADTLHPATYAAVGVTIWFWLRDLLLAPTNAVIKHRALVLDTSFPLFGAAVSGLATVTFDTLTRTVFSLIIAFWLDDIHIMGVVYFIGLLLLGGTLSFALGILIAPICIIFDDFRYTVEIALRYLIFFSFAIFPLSLSGLGEWLYILNPIAVLVVNTRSGLMASSIPDPNILLVMASTLPILVVLALRSFFASEPAVREAIG